MKRLFMALLMVLPASAWAQDILPFPPTPSASQAGVTIESSTYQKRIEPRRLAADAPNILIILIDDVGNGTPSTYDGEINTPTLSRVAGMGVSYNRFHFTAMCSPTRAALLTGRNHTRVGNRRIHPQDRVSTPYREWTFTANTRRMPEFTAPGLGRESNVVEIEMECGENASGVLYALGGSGGGLTVYMDQGHLVYLYNMMIIEQYEARSKKPIAAGKHKIVVETTIAGPGKPGTAIFSVDGVEVGKAELKRTVPAAFTASQSLDIGIDLGSTVADSYYERRPFEFDGVIESVSVTLKYTSRQLALNASFDNVKESPLTTKS